MLTNEDIVRRDLLPRLQRSTIIDPDRIDDIIAVAVRTVSVRIRPGGVNGGLGVTNEGAAEFMRDAESRPGWRRPETNAPAPSAEASSWPQEEFRRLPPLQRLRLANAGVRKDEDGRVRRVGRLPPRRTGDRRPTPARRATCRPRSR